MLRLHKENDVTSADAFRAVSWCASVRLKRKLASFRACSLSFRFQLGRLRRIFAVYRLICVARSPNQPAEKETLLVIGATGQKSRYAYMHSEMLFNTLSVSADRAKRLLLFPALLFALRWSPAALSGSLRDAYELTGRNMKASILTLDFRLLAWAGAVLW